MKNKKYYLVGYTAKTAATIGLTPKVADTLLRRATDLIRDLKKEYDIR